MLSLYLFRRLHSCPDLVASVVVVAAAVAAAAGGGGEADSSAWEEKRGLKKKIKFLRPRNFMTASICSSEAANKKFLLLLFLRTQTSLFFPLPSRGKSDMN